MMRFSVLMLSAALAASFGQVLDLSGLNQLGSKAKMSTNVSLDKEKLQKALKLMPETGRDSVHTRKLLAGLTGVAVRTFEFAKAGDYSLADLAPVRAQLQSPAWSRVVEIKEEDETVEIYMRGGEGKGFAVISAEPKELTVVSIDGTLEFDNVADLALIPKVASTIQFHGPASGPAQANQK